jgi:type I restriction enzyme S subunit
MKRSHLRKGDILMSIVGAIIGNISVVSTNNKATCSCKLAILRPKEIEPLFFATYLKSSVGQNQIQKFRRGGGQTGLILEDFNQFLIPKFTTSFQSSIAGCVSNAHQSIAQSEAKYNAAETLLLEALGLTNLTPSIEAVNIKSFKDSFSTTGRLDAEYYQPKYEEFEKLVLSNPTGYLIIADEFDLVKTATLENFEVFDYIEISDVNVGDGSALPNKVLIDDLPANAKIEAKRGDLIVSKVRPNRGAVSIIDCDDSRLVVSGAFTVLREKPNATLKKETLKVLLRLNLYREWLLKFNVGTQYPVIRDEDILGLPVPRIDAAKQEKLATQIQESFKLKAESERLLEVAKRAVEIAIEQDEQAGLEYIERETGK